MADWPKAISPENRIEYLIDARREVKDETEWTSTPDTIYKGQFGIWTMYVSKSEGQYDALIIETLGDPNGVHDWSITPYPLGLFRDKDDARRALIDEIVVRVAVRQAWEDVAG